MDRAQVSEACYMSSILIGASIFVACIGPTQSREQVTPDEFKEWYTQFELRANDYFCGERVLGKACGRMPDIPEYTEEYPNFTWIERGSGGTCYCYHGDNSTVVVPGDRWLSGCPAHEVGHGVLKRIGDPCWQAFEHEECK